jgi:hypothetical protein
MMASETQEGRADWLFSDGFLGALVVLLTVATAYSAYRGALTGIEGDDLDFQAQRNLVLATAQFQNGNADFMEDIYTYDAYRFFTDLDDEEAAVYLERASEPLRAGLDRPDGPFDEAYQATLYGEAYALLSEVEKLEEQANRADDQARYFELALLLFAVGMAAAAWAALVGSGRRIRQIFLLTAIVSLVAGTVVILQVLFV